MTKKKIKAVREKENTQLHQELAERTRHLFDLRSQAVTEKLEDPSQLGKTRKEIARIKTVLRERELQEQRKAQQQTTTEAAAK
jgi:large subunit ribosomal protein L29